jgi:diguanylate cyclase (GGDEF)-like protein
MSAPPLLSPHAAPRVTRLIVWGAALCLLAVGVHDLSGLDAGALREGLYAALVASTTAVVVFRAIHRRENRLAWGLLAAGMVLWTVGFLFYLHPGIAPSSASAAFWANVGWLAGYPCFCLAVGRLAAARWTALSRPLLLDAVAGATAGAGIVAALIAPLAVVDGDSTVGFATNMTFPIIDTLLLGFALTLLVMSGTRASRQWLFLTAAVVMLGIADVVYALPVRELGFESTTVTDIGWGTAMLAIAAAAWSSEAVPSSPSRLTSAGVAVPTLAVSAAVAVLLYGTVVRVDPWALGLAASALVASAVRTGLTFRDLRALAVARTESLTDDLTGLHNRRYLRAVLDRLLDEADRSSFALMMIDLDGFKELNDSLGHDAGDAVLTTIGERLRGVLGPEDEVARLGGDEFGVILPGMDADGAVRTAERLRTEVFLPVRVHGVHVHVGGSIGIALAPAHGRTPGDILRRADIAMYSAKARRTGYALSTGLDDPESLDRVQLAGEFRGALAAGQIIVHYQPKASMAGHQVVGVEALARWEHPERGILAPAAFLPALELTDLGPQFTSTVLRQAVAQAAAWRRSGAALPVAVNLTSLDLRNERLPDEVGAMLAAEGARPADLMLEVTELGLLSDPERAGRIIMRLRDMGVAVALDDFGTGYSSLTHLQRLKVDRLKIDRSFVARMEHDATAAAIVQSTIELAHALGLEVVAEGVETEAMWRLLDQLGCDVAQGYLLSRPVPAEEVEQLVRRINGPRLGVARAA